MARAKKRSKKKTTRRSKKKSKVAASVIDMAPCPPASSEQAELDRKRREAILFLLRQDIERQMDAMQTKLPHLLEIWSKHRKREPFIRALESRFSSIPTQDLLFLDMGLLQMITDFYRRHEELVLYIEFTQDMILALEEKVLTAERELRPLAEQIFVAIEAHFQEEASQKMVG